jgi:microcystin-dependent protein
LRAATAKPLHPRNEQADFDAWIKEFNEHVPINGHGASAKRRCRLSLTRCRWRAKNEVNFTPTEIATPREATAASSRRLSDQVSTCTPQFYQELMMSDPFLGEIRLFPYPNTTQNVPSGWLECQGQTLSIQQNAALFSLLGTQFGGNGTSTFALPDLRGRTPMGVSPSVKQGYQSGTEGVVLTAQQMGPHNHTVNVSSVPGGNPAGTNMFLAADAPSSVGPFAVYGSATNLTTIAATTVQPNGGNGAHENRQPSLAMVYCIATTGIYPMRP